MQFTALQRGAARARSRQHPIRTVGRRALAVRCCNVLRIAVGWLPNAGQQQSSDSSVIPEHRSCRLLRHVPAVKSVLHVGVLGAACIVHSSRVVGLRGASIMLQNQLRSAAVGAVETHRMYTSDETVLACRHPLRVEGGLDFWRK
jgi:hypothetical protein